MSGVFREEFSRAFLNKRFCIVALLVGISFAYGTTRTVQFQEGSQIGAITLWQGILLHGSYGFFAALMAGIAFGDSLLSDRNHHYLNQVLVRCTYKRYIQAKVLANLCAGAIAVAAPIILLLVGCILTLPLQPYTIPDIPLGFSEIFTPNIIEAGNFLTLSLVGYLALSLVLAMMFGAVYASLGLGFSLLVRNPFIVLGIPFITYSLGYYIIPTSVKLRWLGSPETTLLAGNSLLPSILQYLGLIIIILSCWLAFGHREHLLLD